MKDLDFVVFEPNEYGLRLILSLENNYVNFGGKAQYVQWASYAGQNLHSDMNITEAHTIKLPKSQLSHAAYALIADCRWCLTGTPIQVYVSL